MFTAASDIFEKDRTLIFFFFYELEELSLIGFCTLPILSDVTSEQLLLLRLVRDSRTPPLLRSRSLRCVLAF